MKEYDLVVIGGGPGGYVAAIRSAQLGNKTAVIESERLGGICLNWGCIPTKSLLKNAEIYNTICNSEKYGIKVDNIEYDWGKIIKRSRDISKRLSKGIEYLFKKNKIDYISGLGKLDSSKNIICVNKSGNEELIRSEKIIIATGARPKILPGLEPDGEKILTYKEAMIQSEKPDSLVIVGAGAIGVEFAHFYNRFGTEVTLMEGLNSILPVEDHDISKELEDIFIKRKINILTNCSVEGIEKIKNKVKVFTSKGENIEADKVLIAIGVQGNIEELGLDMCDIATEKGWIKVDKLMATSQEHICAIGDVIGPPWLAHVASAQGIVAAEYLSGKSTTPIDLENIPGCTYCQPEIASVGMSEKSALESGYEIKVGKFPFRALGKSMASGETEGFIKIIYDKKYGEMLGCHIIGSEATNIITEATIARALEGTYEEILKTIHPHPTLSEGILEATADAFGEAIHI